ncbi:glutaminyl-peptide cyclotransferase [Frateuria terrea]|uniref:Glutaminyl-peptide cyclotransferase n=1 Tax=Frateuria terrea TaxID=529704 RepID=A0A1H6WX21_9GAMM|nr:glutaminyl-peptide cyclotransferase [Frateuria terrea]SEJ21439.1 glutaminyl-peptide cyclotransferase [Frateuria terrea]SFP58236.1 glutaminyl-peptide cyclotransferase [Frateuria terrea]
MNRITFALAGLLLPGLAMAASIPLQGYTIVRAFPHDPQAYTEGLFYLDGYLYEATGTVGASSVRKVDLASGKVLQQAATPWPDYGEGIVAWKGRLVQLTWQDHQGFVYDLATLTPLAKFTYPGEGWSLTTDGTHLLMSDGTPTIRILDPRTLQQVGRIDVTADGKPLANLNELEWVKGQLYANVWLTDRIARIDPASGKVIGWIDLAGLGPKPDSLPDPNNDVLNGIAYDAVDDRLFVTGKCWPKVYEIRLHPSRPR